MFSQTKVGDSVVVEGFNLFGPVEGTVTKMARKWITVKLAEQTLRFSAETGVEPEGHCYMHPLFEGDAARVDKTHVERRVNVARAALLTFTVTPRNLDAVEAFIKEHK